MADIVTFTETIRKVYEVTDVSPEDGVVFDFTNVHPERIPHKTPTKEVMDIVSKLSTTTTPPTGKDQVVKLEDILTGYTGKPSDPMKVLTEPMFKKL